MRSSTRGPTGNRTHTRGHPTRQASFKFQKLEITRNTLFIRCSNKKTVIPLDEIQSYALKWYSYHPTGRQKYWLLVLAVRRQNERVESGPIVVAKHNNSDDESELRQHIQEKVAQTIDLMLLMPIRNSNS